MKKDNRYIAGLVSKMTLDEKVGAVMTLGFSGTIVRPHIHDAILKYHCGGLRLTPGGRTFGSYVDPKTGKEVINVESTRGYKKDINAPMVTVSEYREILDGLQKLAMDRPHGIPLHFSFDQEGGSNADFFFGGVSIFPKPMGITATGDSRLAYEIALAISRQGRAAGFSWIHSPCLDINTNPDNPGIGVRSYSDRLEDVLEYAEQTCRGFRDGGMIATGKHFPGRGDTSVDPHYGEMIINSSLEALKDFDLVPYQYLIERKLLPAIMIAHCVYPNIDGRTVSTVSKRIITGIARDHLGFEGVITTDSMTMGAISTKHRVDEACAMALQAGVDLVLMKAENKLVDDTFHTIRRYVLEGKISEEELGDKVYRVLDCKHRYGLFAYGTAGNESPESVIGSRGIAQLAALVARKSVMIVRDRRNLLPLSTDAPVLVIEQMKRSINTLQWHPGKFFKHCVRHDRNAEYLEIDFTPDDADRENVREAIRHFDTVVITSFFSRESKGNMELVNEVLTEKGGKVIVVANTPYPNSIPAQADTVVLSLATSPESMEATAGVLFGNITPEGRWPLQYEMPQ